MKRCEEDILILLDPSNQLVQNPKDKKVSKQLEHA